MVDEVKPLGPGEGDPDKQAQLSPFSEEEIRTLALPPNPSAGHGWCEGGKCYVSCGNGWMKLVDGARHIPCAEARSGWWYMCGGTKYFPTC